MDCGRPGGGRPLAARGVYFGRVVRMDVLSWDHAEARWRGLPLKMLCAPASFVGDDVLPWSLKSEQSPEALRMWPGRVSTFVED